MQNDSIAGRPAIALNLRGMKSNRDAIGARVEVNGQVQYITAGSGFLSQHSKRLHFGLANQPSTRVKITWPSGTTQELANLEPGNVYTITEADPHPTHAPFKPRTLLPTSIVSGKNEPAFGDTWLLEPVPTPQKCPAGFTVLAADNLKAEKPEVAAAYSLFHRYLFEYRQDLTLPLALLVDEQSRVHKVYSEIPNDAQKRDDLARIKQSRNLALPFPGKYYLQPRRNYFKLGAAFYWAGYPDRALPYLAETLRTLPNNWKALLAMGRIQLELGRNQDALASFKEVIEIKNDYPPAFLGAGEAYAKLADTANAQHMFEVALNFDKKYADAMNQLGLLSASSNDLTAARNWFQKAIEMENGHPGAINNLGVLYAKTGKANDSIAAFQYGIKNNPGDDELYLNLARVYVTMSERDKARAVLNSLLEQKPGSTVAVKALAELDAR